MISQIRQAFAGYGQARKAHKAKRAFTQMMQGYDLAIEFARARHRETRPLVQAKRDFLNACLAGDDARIETLFRAPSNLRGRA